jgi:hypothetical protein
LVWSKQNKPETEKVIYKHKVIFLGHPARTTRPLLAVKKLRLSEPLKKNLVQAKAVLRKLQISNFLKSQKHPG